MAKCMHFSRPALPHAPTVRWLSHLQRMPTANQIKILSNMGYNCKNSVAEYRNYTMAKNAKHTCKPALQKVKKKTAKYFAAFTLHKIELLFLHNYQCAAASYGSKSISNNREISGIGSGVSSSTKGKRVHGGCPIPILIRVVGY